MTTSIDRARLLEALMFLMEETFEGHPKPGNVYLDTGTGWRATLEGITATEASKPAVAGGTTIAGHVEHGRYYLAVVREFMNGRSEPADWGESWRVKQVSESEWEALKRALIEESEATRALLREIDVWDENVIMDAIGPIVHSAYHLGAVRQMVMVVRSRIA